MFANGIGRVLTSRNVPAPAGRKVWTLPRCSASSRCCCVIIRAVTSGSASATAGAGPKLGPKPTASFPAHDDEF